MPRYRLVRRDGPCSGQCELGYPAASKDLQLTVQHVNGTAEQYTISDINSQAELLEMIAKRSGTEPANFSPWIGECRFAGNCPFGTVESRMGQ